MDREDARFVAHALERRISGARVELEQLAASSLMRLSAIATRIDKLNEDGEVPATVASEEIMAICRQGATVADVELAPDRRAALEQFIEWMHRLVAEPARPMNRHERRKAAKIQLPRRQRLMRAGAATLADLGLRR